MSKCRDCQHPNCPICGTTHPMYECIYSESVCDYKCEKCTDFRCPDRDEISNI